MVLFTKDKRMRAAILNYVDAQKMEWKRREEEFAVRDAERRKIMLAKMQSTDPVTWAKGAVKIALAVPYMQLEYCGTWLDRPYPERLFYRMMHWWSKAPVEYERASKAIYECDSFTDEELSVIQFWKDNRDNRNALDDVTHPSGHKIHMYLLDHAWSYIYDDWYNNNWNHPFTPEEHAKALLNIARETRECRVKDRTEFDKQLSRTSV